MHLAGYLVALGLLAQGCHAKPTERVEKRQGCAQTLVRREWRLLALAERQAYIAAIQCLMSRPSRSNIPGAVSRYDDYVGTHIEQANEVHFVGMFYPYHRLLVWAFEQALRVECGYQGTQPYWDWLLDQGNMPASPIFDQVYGFGSNGGYIPGTLESPAQGMPVAAPIDFPDRSGGGCLEDGPFAGLTTTLGPEQSLNSAPHCIRRDFAPQTFARMLNIWDVMDAPEYGAFETSSEPGSHAAGHYGIGGLYGTMTDKWASPADPVFWLHHANVDRTWWSWQTRDIWNRVLDISGPLVSFDWDNQQGGNLTLGHLVSLASTGDQLTVADVMNIQGGPLCYMYDVIY